MSAAIEPGMWVECVGGNSGDNEASWGIARGEKPERGRIYRVDRVDKAVGTDGAFRDCLTLLTPKAYSGREREIAWRVEYFRPIYKPNSDFISSLKQPAPKREHENC